MQTRSSWLGWVTASLLVLGGVVGWTLLSPRFVYGEGHALRPIPEFLALWTLIFLGMLLAWRLPWRLPRIHLLVIGVGLAARLILWPSGLIQENDVYRYVLDGQVLLHGENPFAFAPQDYPAAAGGGLARAMEDPAAEVVLDRIGYSFLRTIYPPGSQAVFAVGAWVGGWDWRGQRLVLLGFDLFVALVLWRLSGRVTEARPGFVLYWWNPLILKEIANSAHLDVLVAAALVVAVWWVASPRLPANPGPAALALAAGALFKLYPLMLLPAWLTDRWLGGGRRRSLLVWAGLVPVLCIVGYIPFLGVGWARLTEGLGAYSDRWVMNEGVFALLAWGSDQPRAIAGALIVSACLLVPLLRFPADLAERFYWILLAWFLLIPTPFPWYAIPILSLAPLVPRCAALPAVVLSGAFSLYYTVFLVEYRGLPESWWVAARTIEHGAVWLAILFAWRSRLRDRTPTMEASPTAAAIDRIMT